MDQTLKFIHNGQIVEERAAPPWRTLLDWLRYDRALTGSKEGCAEGDCGACTVVIRDIGPDGRLRSRPVNACIQLLPMLHGKEVVTVEHLSASGDLHPVQRAMAEGHGSQCGFCTPGFVMSLWRAYEDNLPTDPDSVADQIAGNLCRCTGYGPILEAAAAARAMPRPQGDAEEALTRLAVLRTGALDYQAEEARFRAPRHSDDLARMVAETPEATILAGATDIGLWVTKNGFRPRDVIYVGDCADLAEIEETERGLRIPAAVRHDQAMRALGAWYPDMGELWRRFASEQVRASGTLCGNIANGSPIGDAPPALIAAGATLVLRMGENRREMPLEEFFIEYGRQDRAMGEFVEAVIVPRPARPLDLRCYKISKRFDQDISAVMAAIRIEVTDGLVSEARIVFGGMAGTPKRAAAAEAVLIGQPLEETPVAKAMKAMEQDFQPMTDQRASAGYRMQVAKHLLLKYFLEQTFGDLRVTGRGRAA